MMVKYPFSDSGVKYFLDDTIHDIFRVLHGEVEDDINDFDIFVTIGNREVRIPLTPESYECVEHKLRDSVDIWETEYK